MPFVFAGNRLNVVGPKAVFDVRSYRTFPRRARICGEVIGVQQLHDRLRGQETMKFTDRSDDLLAALIYLNGQRFVHLVLLRLRGPIPEGKQCRPKVGRQQPRHLSETSPGFISGSYPGTCTQNSSAVASLQVRTRWNTLKVVHARCAVTTSGRRGGRCSHGTPKDVEPSTTRMLHNMSLSR